jgi:hypothetical protein
VLVGFEPGDPVSAFVVVSPALAVQPVEAVVVPVVAVAAALHVAPVDYAPELIHDAFAVVVAAAAQLHGALVVAVAVVLVLRHVRPAAAVVAQVLPPVQLSPHHDRLGVAPARRAAVRVQHVQCHALAEQAGPVVEEQLVVVMFALAVHPDHDARLAPGTSVPSHDPAQYSRGNP